MKQMLKLGFTLALFASISCICLALVNSLTSPVIAEHAEAELQSGLKLVFSNADSFAEISDFPHQQSAVKINNVYIAKQGSKTAGVVLKATGPTYDKATVLIGVSSDGKITGLRFLSLSDTPGFGQKANEPEWYNQFTGKSVNDGFVLGSDVDAVSGATITSKGVVQIIHTALETVASLPADLKQQ